MPAKEYAGDHWVLRGDRGLTYSSKPLERSKITEGVWWEPGYEGPAQISFAEEEGREGGKERKTGWRGLWTHACDALLDE